MEKCGKGAVKQRSVALPRRGKKENAPVAIAEAGDAYEERLRLVQSAMQSTLLEGERWMGRCSHCSAAAVSEGMDAVSKGEEKASEHTSACVGSAGEHRPVAEKIAVGETSMLASHGVVRVLVKKTRHLASIGRTIRMCRGAQGDEVEEVVTAGAEKRPVKGVLCLTPVEALHLIDRRVLLLLQRDHSVFDDAVPNGPFLSLSECYCLLLGVQCRRMAPSADVALMPFSVFSHMKKLGYVLFSATPMLQDADVRSLTMVSHSPIVPLHRSWWPPLPHCESTLVPCSSTPCSEESTGDVSWSPACFQAFQAVKCEDWLAEAAGSGWSFFTVFPASKEFSRSKSQPSLLLACASYTALDANLPLRAVSALVEWARHCHGEPLPLALCFGDAGLKLSFLSIEAGLAPPQPKSSRRKRH